MIYLFQVLQPSKSVSIEFLSFAICQFVIAANTHDSMNAIYPRSENMDSLLKSVVFAGSICGQCSMGFVGDWIGLENAMVATNFMALLGTIGWYVYVRVCHSFILFAIEVASLPTYFQTIE